MDIVLSVVGIISGILLFVFWVGMIVDISRNQPPETKVGWIIFLVFANFPAAIFYYFTQYRQRIKKTKRNNIIMTKDVGHINTTIKVCSNCGAKVDIKSNYCSSCGNKVTG